MYRIFCTLIISIFVFTSCSSGNNTKGKKSLQSDSQIELTPEELTAKGDEYCKIESGDTIYTPQAMKMYKSAAEKGYAEGQYKYACCLHSINNDIDGAIIWYQKAAEQNHVASFINIGWLFEHEKNDIYSAIRWYKKAADFGNTTAMKYIGWIYEDKKNANEAELWYMKMIMSGDSDGFYWMGVLYQHMAWWDENQSNDEYYMRSAIEWYQTGSAVNNEKCMEALAGPISSYL